MREDEEMVNTIPSAGDWGDIAGDFDLSDAYRTFFGRSNREMQSCFAKNVMSRAQDIRFMPKVPFMYYMQGFSEFVLSESYGDQAPSDVANCFLSVVQNRTEVDPSAIVPIIGIVSKALDFIANNQESLGACAEIYGDFREKSALIQEKLNSTSSVHRDGVVSKRPNP